MAGNGIVTMMLILLLLVVGKAENIASLSFNDPQEASTSPHPINTPPTLASPQAPAPPLPINTQQEFPSPYPIDTPIAFPSPYPIDTPIGFPSIPGLPIPGRPKNRYCTSMCSKRCTFQRRSRFAYVKCLGLCNLKCMGGGISNVVFDCTQNCAESKSPNFNTDADNVLDFVNSCYEDCKKN